MIFHYFGAGMNAGARDLGRFGFKYFKRESITAEQIVPASWISNTIAGDSGYKQRFAASEHGPMMPSGHYKNKMWVVDENIMLCIGIHGQFISNKLQTQSLLGFHLNLKTFGSHDVCQYSGKYSIISNLMEFTNVLQTMLQIL
nr:MAG: hypothetical protein CM15mP61_12350 [Gammaproteobacteria bacterium]